MDSSRRLLTFGRAVSVEQKAGALGQFSVMSVDDHSLFRTGIELIVKSAFPKVNFSSYPSLGEALDGGCDGPDVLLLDLHLEGIGGHAAIPLVKLRWPNAAIIVVTSEQDQSEIEHALKLGADLVVLKSQPPEHFIGAIRKLAPIRDKPGKEGDKRAPALSRRQLEVLGHLREGLSNKVIARRMDISEYTVRGHVQQILKMLNASSRAQAVFEAQKAGVL